MRAKEVEKVSFPQYNSKKEEGPSQDGDYTILTRPLLLLKGTVFSFIIGLKDILMQVSDLKWEIHIMRILIVEDEVRLAEALGEIMKAQRYTTDIVYDGEAAFDNAISGIYDCIILDVMIPKMDGFEVVRRMRAEKNTTPVIMLTAKDDTVDKIKGLDAGADDYLTKPFIPGELLARVRAISRRQGEVVMDELEYEDLVLSLSNYTLEGNGKSLPLGPKEFEIMRLLMSAPNVIVPKEDFIVKVWGAESDAEDNNVEVYISFLRKKLKHLNSRVSITTVRKIGYRLEVSA